MSNDAPDAASSTDAEGDDGEEAGPNRTSSGADERRPLRTAYAALRAMLSSSGDD